MSTPRENLRRALEEYYARRFGGRWSVSLAGDPPRPDDSAEDGTDKEPDQEERT